jgi:hypothetical protein
VERNVVAHVRVTILFAALAPAGCYDMERLDPGPESSFLLIDNFEDGDDTPSVTTFDDWKAYPFKKGPGSSERIAVEESGVDGGFALVGNFVFTYLNGDFTGASMGIVNANPLLDVRRYRALHVASRFAPGSGSLPPNTRYYAELGCNSVVPIGNEPSPYYVQLAMPVTGDWQASPLPLERFVEPSPEQPKIAGGPPACLAAVDSIRFTISMSLGPGAESGGTFSIDDVSFE